MPPTNITSKKLGACICKELPWVFLLGKRPDPMKWNQHQWTHVGCGLQGRERLWDKRKDLHSKGTVNKRIGRKVQNNHREGRKKNVSLFQIIVRAKSRRYSGKSFFTTALPQPSFPGENRNKWLYSTSRTAVSLMFLSGPPVSTEYIWHFIK